jgi:benzoyl-CoA reductase/2-hydroxyglutaryl-CoA dehydratase subunit BcrC/BadD/HgdB
MTTEATPYVGFTCAYTPLALIDAAGYAPYRILPVGDSPDMAGQILHDNLCPHVKRVLDRALDNHLPKLEGVILLNSCDAMRRLADGWPQVRPQDRLIFLDLPVTSDDAAVEYFRQELARLQETLSQWSGRQVTDRAVSDSVEKYRQLAAVFESLRDRLLKGALAGGAARLQGLYNEAVTSPFSHVYPLLRSALEESELPSSPVPGVPMLVFGNVLADPEAFSLFESCGVRIVDEDFCTGSRVFNATSRTEFGDILTHVAHELLNRPRCARTIHAERPGILAEEIVERARAAEVRGVIACTAKFCDPYIARMPAVRDALRNAGLPLLHIEGDCTMRSFGQQRTRIEAFVEMLS